MVIFCNLWDKNNFMAKPICVIYYNPEISLSANGVRLKFIEMNDAMVAKFPDYNVLALPSYAAVNGDAEDIRLEVFNAANMDEIDFDSFKAQILESIMEGQEG